MKKNLPVSQQDIPMRENSRIVSTTNLAGQITYANQDFCEISGFHTDELHMQHHNIIRHPDMPQAAYKMLWDKVKSGGSWMGIVKNRCKNGDHYWVDALVTPLKEKGKTIGYQSVRMKPKSEHITNATSLYKKLNGGKTASTFSLGLLAKLYLLVAVVFACSWVPSALLDSKLSALIAAGLATLIFGGGLAFWIAQPWLKAAATSKSIIDDPIAVRTYTGRSDELGQLLLAQHMLHAKLQTVIWRLNDSATELENVSHNAEAIAKGTTEDMNQQQGEVQQVATAMTEMVSTVSEIAANSSAASEAAQSAEANANAGRKVVSEGVEITQKLSRQVKETAAVIESLKAVADKIGGVVEVIRTIADQTNLLALNAAIEAARAGAQGRGFAVVADEVRSLARKTQSSTDEIQTMIQALQSTVGEAVASMGASEKITESSLQKSAAMEVSLNDILRSIETASNMVLHIATAAEEQGAVAEEINRNIFNINDLSDSTVNSTQKAHTSINDLGGQISKLKTIVNQFTNNH